MSNDSIITSPASPIVVSPGCVCRDEKIAQPCSRIAHQIHAGDCFEASDVRFRAFDGRRDGDQVLSVWAESHRPHVENLECADMSALLNGDASPHSQICGAA